jgi:hypothetical protein
MFTFVFPVAAERITFLETPFSQHTAVAHRVKAASIASATAAAATATTATATAGKSMTTSIRVLCLCLCLRVALIFATCMPLPRRFAKIITAAAAALVSRRRRNCRVIYIRPVIGPVATNITVFRVRIVDNIYKYVCERIFLNV